MSADCLFCGIVAGSIPATVVAESEHTVAFRDLNPQAPTHVLIIPREHHPDAAALAAAAPDVLAEMHVQARAIAEAEGVAEAGYRSVFNTGSQAGQSVFHAHLHLLGGRDMTWPPG